MKKNLALGISLLLIIILAGCAWQSGSLFLSAGKVKDTDGRQWQKTSSEEVRFLRQIVAADNQHGRTFMWQSQKEETGSVVEYRLQGENHILSQKAAADKFTDDGETMYIYRAALEKLEAGKQYEYRVGFQDKRSAWLTFTTDNGKAFKALIFPDSQSADYQAWKQTLMPAWEKNRDASIFINMGDLVDNGEDKNQWRSWFEAAEPLLTQIPFAPVLGNHETYSKKWEVRAPQAYLHFFSLPKAGPEQYQNQFYSFDYGPVHFTVLNTQFEELKDWEPELLPAELAWLKTDLESSRQPWKIILMHKDVLQYAFQTRPGKREAGISSIGKIFMPLFDQYGVDAVLTAHLHTYRRRGHIYDFQRSERGPLYIITGVAGDVRYPNLWKEHALDEAVAPQPETDNYLTLEADAGTLTFKAFLSSGQQIDAATLKK